MKTMIIAFFILVFSFAAAAQNTEIQNMKIETKKAYFPGGDSLFFATVSKNLHFSEEAKTKQIKTEVMVSFDVMPDSTLSNISIINNPGYGIGEAVKSAITNMKFVPSMAKGTPMRSSVMISIPIRTY